jgi:hypothetical protein
MADKDRLLKVMLQEEMGFRLEEHPHPLVQGVCASFGASISFGYIVLLYLGCSMDVLIVGVAGCIAVVGALMAKFERNLMIPAFIWNASVTSVIVVVTRMCLKLLLP